MNAQVIGADRAPASGAVATTDASPAAAAAAANASTWKQKLRSADGKQSYLFVDGAAQSKLEALFRGSAHLTRARAMPPDPGAAWILVQGDAWYLYDRNSAGTLARAGARSFCQFPPMAEGTLIGITARVSKDKGATWSEPIYVAWPTGAKGDPDGCQVLDGATFFDQDDGTWHLWAQCIGEVGSQWNMCHYTGVAPTGPFTRRSFTANGAIWSSLCRQSPETCGTGDEGTPEILYKKDGYFYVSFHGFRGSDSQGFRAMAKTRDFIQFTTSASDLPKGPILSAQDCSGWNPGCIGFGAASTVLTETGAYVASEGPTQSLGCVAGQTWSWGMMKGSTTTASGQWEQSPVNAVVKGAPGIDCSTVYLKFFQSGDDVFAFYMRWGAMHQGSPDYSLYKIEVDAPRAASPSSEPPAARTSASETTPLQIVPYPLLDYVQPVNGARHRDNAWLAATPAIGDLFCAKRFGAGWTYDAAHSVIENIKVNICNVDVQSDASGRLFCTEGVTGSYYPGDVITTIACAP